MTPPVMHGASRAARSAADIALAGKLTSSSATMSPPFGPCRCPSTTSSRPLSKHHGRPVSVPTAMLAARARPRRILVLGAALCMLLVAAAQSVAAASSPESRVALRSHLGQHARHLQGGRRDTPLVPNDAVTSGYMCRCTCFGTNSTVVPLPPPVPGQGGNACSACTKQFCLGLRLDMCQGAQAGSADQDTGTGYEGDVWARCFQKDTEKDYAVICLYLLAIGCLLAWATVRPHMHTWIAVRS